MYKYITDKKFLGKFYSSCADIVNRLVQSVNKDGYLEIKQELIGSGNRKLITQNANEPIDIDYNIWILDWSNEINIDKPGEIKDYLIKKTNEVLQELNLRDCQDSTSSITTPILYLEKDDSIKFSIDIGIVIENNEGEWFRLIHHKRAKIQDGSYEWQQGPNNMQDIYKKEQWLKRYNLWNEFRHCYLEKKNLYIRRVKDKEFHPSYNCYIEAINEIFNKYYEN